MTTLAIRNPTVELLPSYEAALLQGWHPRSIDGARGAQEHLAALRADSAEFVAGLDDPEGRGAPIRLLDGSFVPRLPGLERWIWDGEFCGSIALRWQQGTTTLPPYTLGHIGYNVVPWKRCLGRATAALALMLPVARSQGLAYVELTSDPGNVASHKVITANGGKLVERFLKTAAQGGTECLRFRIELNGDRLEDGAER